MQYHGWASCVYTGLLGGSSLLFWPNLFVLRWKLCFAQVSSVLSSAIFGFSYLSPHHQLGAKYRAQMKPSCILVLPPPPLSCYIIVLQKNMELSCILVLRPSSLCPFLPSRVFCHLFDPSDETLGLHFKLLQGHFLTPLGPKIFEFWTWPPYWFPLKNPKIQSNSDVKVFQNPFVCPCHTFYCIKEA